MDTKSNTEPLAPVTFDEFAPTSYETWKAAAIESLKGGIFEKKLFTKTPEGIVLSPIYTEEEAAPYKERLGFPGAADFLRGTKTAGYTEEPWKIAQEVETRDPVEANKVLLEELNKGASAVNFDVDAVELNTLKDVETLLNEVQLRYAPLAVYAGATALPLLSAILKRQEKVGDDAPLTGCVGADPVGEAVKKGGFDSSFESYMDQMATTLKYATNHAPELKTIYVQSSVYHNGGANAIQEAAAALATGLAYIDAMMERGYTVDQAAEHIRFNFCLGPNFFMEIAKLRAVRVVWAQLMQAYGAGEKAQCIDVFAETSQFTTTLYDPYVNVLRATTQAFSGVVGGVSGMKVLPFDAAVRDSDGFSRRIARNIQVMMQEEFNLLSPVDPAGGSWYVETLTGQLGEAIWNQIQKIQAAGGMLEALRAGTIQSEIEATLKDRFKRLATRQDRAVGSNMYPNMSEKPLDGIKTPKAPKAAGKAVKDLGTCVKCVGAALEDGATLADIAASYADGKAETFAAILPHRWTEQYEALRKATEDYIAKTGDNVKVFLCNMGPIPQHKARADFSASFMEVAHFDVLRNNGFATVDEAVDAAVASGADVAIICSTDDTYPELVPPVARGIKAKAPNMKVYLAGAPAPEFKPSYDEAGVDEYIHVRANCLAILTNIQKGKGII